MFGFAEKLSDRNVTEEPNPFPVRDPSYYDLEKFTWNQVWTYRRLYNPVKSQVASTFDVTLQNWGRGKQIKNNVILTISFLYSGNDYAFGYLFKSRSEAQLQINDWRGGIQIENLREAEYLAYGWHYAFKKMNETAMNRIFLEKEEVFGTCHGLSKMPYIRDTRRSIGIDKFVLKIADITGDWSKGQLTGNKCNYFILRLYNRCSI